MQINQYTSCSTAGVRPLDLQLINQINRIAPGLLVDFSKLNVSCGGGCHPFLQAPAAVALEKAIAARGQRLIVNSAYRTIVQQYILYSHFRHKRCGITAAAKPGQSNHNTGLSIDVEDSAGWRPYLERFGWDYLGSFDPMHFDYHGTGCKNLSWLATKAFQQLWNYNNPERRIIEDGDWGVQTEQVLKLVPVTGFDSVPGFERGEKLEDLSPVAQSLRIGDRGEAVAQLQRKLGILSDGIFGARTTTAVEKFQRENGLTVDGVAGVQTMRSLNG
ncbi:peptidoglycan-binding protein [Trichocoleus sp. DQ-A3]|uniref:peptidoglycan-binding protein n=1 Tax=Cyanophyceae TaxID=3028117 RepID=UPI001681D9F2|nr:peptidoglycan-binding protein [Coleofasciculus sp. FACHB-125]MBD1899257.1 peptidoglycan-binding protein [Coleofasciculus sp. FACHB-125]